MEIPILRIWASQESYVVLEGRGSLSVLEIDIPMVSLLFDTTSWLYKKRGVYPLLLNQYEAFFRILLCTLLSDPQTR
jgi:hypothetical protein